MCTKRQIFTTVGYMSLFIGKKEFIWGTKTYVMGIVNCTPDSFSGDGIQRGVVPNELDVNTGVEQALRMVEDGADIIDIGGESTRPASIYPNVKHVSADEELQRIIPVIQRLKGQLGAVISVDTRKAEVAKIAIQEGAELVNDVSMLSDPDMYEVISSTGIPIIVSHTRKIAQYRNVISEIVEDIQCAILGTKGIALKRVIADPGIGFGKAAKHSIEAIRNVSQLKSRLGLPVLIGVSRKSFIASVLQNNDIRRLEGTAAAVAISISAGVDIVRVHDVQNMVRVCKMSDAIVRGKFG